VFCGLKIYRPATFEWGTDGKSAADILSLISPSTQVINRARECRKGNRNKNYEIRFLL
jgi:hypothetical protein